MSDDHDPYTMDRLYACAPFFLGTSSPPEINHKPLRLRGGGRGRHNAKAKAKAQAKASAASSAGEASSGSRRLQVPTASRVKTRSSRRGTPFVDLENLDVEAAAIREEVARLNLALRDVKGDGNCMFRVVSDQTLGEEKDHLNLRKLTCDFIEAHEEAYGYWVTVSSDIEGETFKDHITRMRQPGQYAGEIELFAMSAMLKRHVRLIRADRSETVRYDFEAPRQAEGLPEPAEPQPQPEVRPEPTARAQTPVAIAAGPIPSTSLPSNDVHTVAAAEDPMQTPGRIRLRTRSSTTCLLQTPANPPPSSPFYATALSQYFPPIKEGRTMIWIAHFTNAEHYQSIRRKGDRERIPAEIEDRFALPHGADTSDLAKLERGELLPSHAGASTLVNQVKNALPAGHKFTVEHMATVLSRTKGDVSAAVQILSEEMDGSSDITELSDVDSDGKVEAMLVDPVEDSPPHPTVPIPTVTTTTTAAAAAGKGKDKAKPKPHPASSSDYRNSSPPIRTVSPSGSSNTTTESESDLSRHSSAPTTPSTSSRRSKRSRSVNEDSDESKGKAAKPYDRPKPPSVRPGSRSATAAATVPEGRATTGRRTAAAAVAGKKGKGKGKEISRELEELQMGAVLFGEGKAERERRKSIGEQEEKRKGGIEALRAARERSRRKA